MSTYNTYNARDQIVTLKNICDECEWVISQYDYTYDDRGFITGEDVVESLYGYAWDDKHDGKHENWHDELYPHGNKHPGKHDKDGEPNYQIIGTKRTFEYDDDSKLLKATEKEDVFLLTGPVISMVRFPKCFILQTLRLFWTGII